MSSNTHETRKAYWEPIIKDWKTSNRSAISYCKEHKITPSCFSKWKGFFEDKPKLTVNSFIELPSNSLAELEIESKKYTFRLKAVDILFVSKFMKILKDLSC
jgi:hypothetical protein